MLLSPLSNLYLLVTRVHILWYMVNLEKPRMLVVTQYHTCAYSLAHLHIHIKCVHTHMHIQTHIHIHTLYSIFITLIDAMELVPRTVKTFQCILHTNSKVSLSQVLPYTVCNIYNRSNNTLIISY